jgi:glycosidase
MYAQILSVTPAFPTENDTVTILYNATEGNGQLKNLSGNVYAHAGLITSKSTSGTDWKYVQGVWGTADPKVLMTSLGNNIYKIKYHIKSFYGLPTGETALRLAFVFRNADGSKVGRNADGSDIFYDLGSNKFTAKILSPAKPYSFATLNDSIFITASSSTTAKLELWINGSLVKSDSSNQLLYKYGINSTCVNLVVLKATAATTVYDTLYIVVPDQNMAVYPAGAVDGITYLSDSKIRFSIYAPGKKHIYVIGDFNNWTPSCTYQMQKTPDGNRFWLEVSGFTPGKDVGFQYLIDGTLKIADPYSTVVIDGSNDGYISSTVYPNLYKFPASKTTGLVSLLSPAQTPYKWQDSSYKRPLKTDLVVYELLIRDFVATHSYKTLKDTLGYLKRLGINCIELMPVMEFEGNSSWGYNVSYHMALDKYYGRGIDFKAFIDACHQNGIAVVLDIALNHAFSQNSLAQMYWDAANSKPSKDNPWLNPDAKHPYNVGSDFNHESAATKYYVDRVLKYWVEEFKIDGFRFDLSKGFTQNNTGSDVGLWGKYDQSRINIIDRMGKQLWKLDSGLFLILEHFADNDEETVLSNLGFMLWGNLVYSYNQATMAYSSDLSWGSYKQRNWTKPNLVTYLESHDEERLMFKNTKSGNSSGSYNTKDINTALKRLEQAGAFFFTIPGPKMIWQFVELGYDISIDQNGRLGEKPILWSYQNNPNRAAVYNIWSQLIKLRTEQPVFETTDFTASLGSVQKSIVLRSPSQNVVVLGNFNLVTNSISANFPKLGRWYEYFTNDSIEVTTATQSFNFQAGEYRLYSSTKMGTFKPLVSTKNVIEQHLSIYPNPVNDALTIVSGSSNNQIKNIVLLDLTGKLIATFEPTYQESQTLDLSAFKAGMYFLRMEGNDGQFTKKIIIE